MQSRRAYLVAPRKFEICEVEVNPEAEQLLIKVNICGLCSWELNHFKGLLGKCPQPLGHEWVGTVVAMGEKVKDFSTGDVVTGLEGGMAAFSDYIVSRATDCFKIDKSINPEQALGEPLKCIVTVLRAAAPEAGDYGVVLGCGSMGLWCTQALAGNLLGRLIAVDVDNYKLELAKEFGATDVINPQNEDASQRIAEITSGEMADFVIEGTGIPSVLNKALKYLKGKNRGRLILMSSHEEVCREFDFIQAINKSIELKVPHPGYSMNQKEDMRRAVLLLNKGVFKMRNMITHRFRLEDIQKAFEVLENKPKGYIKGVVTP
jgi:threonine dehydrogenase-like Zn-dependent dehydrogenase